MPSSPFFPRRKSPGCYFNTGRFIYSIQQDKDVVVTDSVLVAAIEAAFVAFSRVYRPFDEPTANSEPTTPAAALGKAATKEAGIRTRSDQ